MRSLRDISTKFDSPRAVAPVRTVTANALLLELEACGVVRLPNVLSDVQLDAMRAAFETRLRRMRWNNVEGYQKTELYRHMVEDVLLLDQAFLDIALHPLIKEILNGYLGNSYELTEAKGWKSLATKRDFHGWHGDAWYDQTATSEIHREVKLAVYLTDVQSGAFNFIKGTHRKEHPRALKKHEVNGYLTSQIVELAGPAGTAFLFDTSGIHRQSVPMLEPRQAIFYNYHDPRVRLQQEDVDYYRYHPLLLNAAFLGDLSAEDQRILGFGNKTNLQPAFERRVRTPWGYKAFNTAYNLELRARDLSARIHAKLRRAIDRANKS